MSSRLRRSTRFALTPAERALIDDNKYTPAGKKDNKREVGDKEKKQKIALANNNLKKKKRARKRERESKRCRVFGIFKIFRDFLHQI